jgi:hypothetical protein
MGGSLSMHATETRVVGMHYWILYLLGEAISKPGYERPVCKTATLTGYKINAGSGQLCRAA